MQAIGHCVNCQVNLCGICLEAHLRQRSTSKHTTTTLDDFKKKQHESLKEQNTSVTRSTLKCYIHPTQDLKLYCVNCDQVACHNCTILLHKGHKFETIAVQRNELSKNSKNHLNEIKNSMNTSMIRYRSYLVR